VGAYRAGVEHRLRRAEIARAEAEVQAREERKRKRVLVAWAVSGLLFALAVAGAGWGWQRDRDARLNQTRAEVAPALSRAEQRCQEAQALAGTGLADAERRVGLLRQARAAVEQAESAAATGLADDGLRGQVAEARRAADAAHGAAEAALGQALKDQAFATALEGARELRFAFDGRKFDKQGASNAYARAFAEYGCDVLRTPAEEAAAWLGQLPPVTHEPALFALTDWWSNAPDAGVRQRLFCLAGLADDDPWRCSFRLAAQGENRAELLRLAQEARKRTLPAFCYDLLGGHLGGLACWPEAADLLRKGRLAHPSDFWIPFTLGGVLADSGRTGPLRFERPDSPAVRVLQEEIAGCYLAALAVRPNSLAQLHQVSVGFHNEGRFEEAFAVARRMIEVAPDNALGHGWLGSILLTRTMGRQVSAENLAEAVVALGKAIERDPRYLEAYLHLGSALQAQQKSAEALDVCRRAVALFPDSSAAHEALGKRLEARRDLEGADAAYRKALEIDPHFHPAYTSLSQLLVSQRKLDEAAAICRAWVAQSPEDLRTYRELIFVLVAADQLEEAGDVFRQAIRNHAYGGSLGVALGNALRDRGRLPEAIATFRTAAEHLDKDAFLRKSLGIALLEAGQFAEARDCFQRALKLYPAQDAARPDTEQQLRFCERLLPLEARLADLLAGREKPATAADTLALADLCRLRKRHAAAAAFAAAAFGLDPKQADDLNTSARYNAACAAVLAAAGRGVDAPPEGTRRAELRAQALTWLRADLAARTKDLETDTPAHRRWALQWMVHWQGDADLASVRGNLPTEAESRDWASFWADVEQARQKANASTK
jgi:tetratricopeptide (TPR) repeat protein